MPILIHGNSKVPELQQKNVKSTTVQQEITPSEGYDGFNKIIVSPIKLQEKPATPSTIEQVITPDSTYDGLSKVTVEAVKSVVQATPAITVATNGLITALATQSAGYVSAGTKSTTKQMTTQAGTTINPGTSRKLAVQSRRYTTGDIYVAGDSNLVADNIKKGVSIFGVAGTYADVAKVYVAHNITPAKLTPSSSDTWISCAQITMRASDITKLLDTSNSAETLSPDLYGKPPNAVVATLSSIWNLPTQPQFVSHFECYGDGYDSYTSYNGASYGYVYTSLSSTDKSRTFKCLADNTNGTVIGQLFLPSNYNMSTSNSYDVYLIY